MSGGSLEYFSFKVDDVINLLTEHESTKTSALRQEFVEHLKLVSKALHDIEWVDSGDCTEGDEDEAISAVLRYTARIPEPQSISNWRDAIEYVLSTGRSYVHPQVTIEKANGSNNLCLVTTEKSEYLDRKQALIALNKLDF